MRREWLFSCRIGFADGWRGEPVVSQARAGALLPKSFVRRRRIGSQEDEPAVVFNALDFALGDGRRSERVDF